MVMLHGFQGADYGPFRGAETPNGGPFPTAAEMEADFPQLAGLATAIRVYSVSNGFGYIVERAAAYGLQAIPSAFLVNPATPGAQAANQTELDNLIALLNSTDLSNVPFAVVGSEFLLNNPTQYAYLLQQIAYVRSHVPPTVKLTTAETWYNYLTAYPDLGNQVDLVFPNILPFWEPGGMSVSGAASFVVSRYNALAAHYPNRQVVISETGWPSQGTNGVSVGSIANQQAFWSQFISFAQQNGVSYFGFEAFDEPWKTAEGAQGPHWGLYDASRQPKGPVASFEATPAASGDFFGSRQIDFNGDGSSDILWQNTNGTPAVWLLNGTNPLGVSSFANQGSSWRVKGTADFNADSKSDILWQNDDGTPAIWLMDGAAATSVVSLTNPGTSWHLRATGDFNADGRSDILWQNANGAVAIWEMNGSSVTGAASFANPGASWHIRATADFNGDGRSDLLWQNDNGTAAIWEMDGTSVIAAASFANPGRTWHIKATGDFNGDGKSDILWQNDNGNVALWELNGTSVIAAVGFANPGDTWRVKAVADVNADGASDIIWQNNNGSPAIWEINGASVIAVSNLPNPGPAWHVKGSYDFNADGKADILWQNDNGSAAIWELDGTTVIGAGTLPNPGASWQVIGSDGLHFIDGTGSAATLVATPAADQFVLTSFTPGAHVISGFDIRQDIIEFSAATFGGLPAVEAAATASANGVVIQLTPGSSLLLSGVSPDALSPGNFVFA